MTQQGYTPYKELIKQEESGMKDIKGQISKLEEELQKLKELADAKETKEEEKSPYQYLIDNKILCVFLGADGSVVDEGFLSSVNGRVGAARPFETTRLWYPHCRPLLNHWHFWEGGECPLPEGVLVKVMLRNGGPSTGGATRFNWSYNKSAGDIIAFKILEWPY